MTENIPDEIKKDLEHACTLHEQAVSDYEKCMAFSKLMSDVLARLEEAKCWDTADKVMAILLDCNPKTGTHCDKATLVAGAIKKLKGLIR